MGKKLHIYIVNTRRNLNGNHPSEINVESDFKRIFIVLMFEQDFEIGNSLKVENA